MNGPKSSSGHLGLLIAIATLMNQHLKRHSGQVTRSYPDHIQSRKPVKIMDMLKAPT
jgi:ribosomal protein L16/L10AE